MRNYLSSLLCSILQLHYTNSNSTQCSLTSTGSCRGTRDLALTMVRSRVLAAPFLLFWPRGRHLLAVSVFLPRSLHLCSALLGPSSCGSQGAGVGQGALHGGIGSKWLLRSGLLCFFPQVQIPFCVQVSNLHGGKDERLLHLLLCVERDKR